VNDAHICDATLFAFVEIVGYEVFDITRMKQVQVEFAVYWEFDWVRHTDNCVVVVSFPNASIGNPDSGMAG
jgi:hypothetical protein